MTVLSACGRPARLFPMLGCAVVMVCVAAGCGTGAGRSGVATSDTPSWHEVSNSKAGFTVQVRDGWTVDASGALISIHAGKDAVALVRPVLAASAESASDCLGSNSAILSDALPGLTVTSTKDISSSDAVGELQYGDSGLGRVLCHTDGRAEMLYAIAGQSRAFSAQRADLVASLDSLRFQAAAGPSDSPSDSVSYVTWTDPIEQAFTLSVPAGWTVNGGLTRKSSVDVRASVTVTSPDGSIVVSGPSDPNVGSFTVPNDMLSMGGYSQGSTYSPGYGVNLTVEPYADGQTFAANYVQNVISQNCPGTEITNQQARTDVTTTENQLYAQNGLSNSVSAAAGEVTYTCSQDGSNRSGYQFADTLLASASTSQLWQAEFLWGYTAPTDQAALAASVLKKMAATFRYDPNWTARQSNTTISTSHIVEQTEQAIASDIAETNDTSNATQDHVDDNWSKATLGQTDVTDPDTGTTWRVESGHNYYWHELDGSVAGSDNAPPPDVNITPLETS